MRHGGRLQRAGHGIDATGEGEGERGNACGTAQFEFVLAECVIVHQKIHARRVNGDVAFFLAFTRAGAEACISRCLFASELLAVLRDYNLGGWDVVGVTMRLWGGESDTGCCSVADVDDARRVAQQLRTLR